MMQQYKKTLPMLNQAKHIKEWQKFTIIPGDDACIISGLNWETSDIILGLSARESGTFWYHGQGKLQNRIEKH